MNFKFSLLTIFILLISASICNSQITLRNVKSISITDKVNINYEHIKSYEFEIRFTDTIELWHTMQITKAEFFEKNFMGRQINLIESFGHTPAEKRNKEDFRKGLKELHLVATEAYIVYCDTVAPEFVSYIEEPTIIELLDALQDTTVTRESFDNNYDLAEGYDYEFGISWTSYYPVVGMTLISRLNDTLVAYSDVQGDLILPWTIPGKVEKTFNPKINRALYSILPKDLNYNRKRLVTGLKYQR